MAGGIERGIASLMAGYEKKREGEKKLVQNAKISDSIMKVNPEMLERLGMTPEQWGALGAGDKVAMSMGAIEGLMQETRMKQARQQEQINAETLADLRYNRMQDVVGGEEYRRGMLEGPEALGRTPLLGGRAAADIAGAIERLRPQKKTINTNLLPTNLDGVFMNPNSGTPFEPKGKEFTGEDFKTIPQAPGWVFNKRSGVAMKVDGGSSAPSKTYPWLMSDDKEELRRGLAEITDPEELKAVAELRAKVNSALGKKDDLMEQWLISQLQGKEGKTGAPSVTGKTPKVRRYNPKTGKIE